MSATGPPTAPPFCPNPACACHRDASTWRCVRDGHFTRHAVPHRIQRYRCRHCGRRFSEQTFRTTYWLKRPGLLAPVFHGLVAGSGLRQLARSLGAAPNTVGALAARLGRHCLLYHEQHRPRGPVAEPLALDSFQSFEFSQYSPTLFHLLVGKESHFAHGFTDSELRRSGRMSARQKRRRAWLEARFGRPDPRSIEHEVACLLAVVLPERQRIVLHTDEHQDYPRALRRVGHLEVEHHTISSRALRDSRNPLFALNLYDMLIRHSSANHRRETIAFSKRRQAAAERLWVLLVWRNWLKWFSERLRSGTPAMRVGIATRKLGVDDVLAERLFVDRIGLPERWARYYWRLVPTRRIARCSVHRRRYAN